MYSLCQVVDECKEVKGKSSGASQSLAQQCDNDASKRDTADGYLIEKSPQRLIEKLSIAPTHTRPTTTLGADDSSAFSLLAQPAAGVATPTTNPNGDYFCIRPKPAPSSAATSVLQQRSPSPICLSDFFCDSVRADGPTSASSPATSSSGSAVSSLSPVASATSSAASSPSYPLSVDANWLINAPYDPSSLPSRIVYQLPYSSGDSNPQKQQRAQRVHGSPSSTSSSHELAEANVAPNGNPSEDSFQVTVGSTNAGGDTNLEKTLYGTRSLSSIAETPKPSTINVFVPFTEDMDKGFLAFTNDETELTSKCNFFFNVTSCRYLRTSL